MIAREKVRPTPQSYLAWFWGLGLRCLRWQTTFGVEAATH